MRGRWIELRVSVGITCIQLIDKKRYGGEGGILRRVDSAGLGVSLKNLAGSMGNVKPKTVAGRVAAFLLIKVPDPGLCQIAETQRLCRRG